MIYSIKVFMMVHTPMACITHLESIGHRARTQHNAGSSELRLGQFVLGGGSGQRFDRIEATRYIVEAL